MIIFLPHIILRHSTFVYFNCQSTLNLYLRVERFLKSIIQQSQLVQNVNNW